MKRTDPKGPPVEPACAAAAREMCHRPWRERCGRIGWRLTAGDLLVWSGPGRRVAPLRDGAIPVWIAALRVPRGCALAMSLAEVVPGVDVATTVEFLVDVGFAPEAAAADMWDGPTGRRLAALGDADAVRHVCQRTMASIHDATARRPRS